MNQRLTLSTQAEYAHRSALVTDFAFAVNLLREHPARILCENSPWQDPTIEDGGLLVSEAFSGPYLGSRDACRETAVVAHLSQDVFEKLLCGPVFLNRSRHHYRVWIQTRFDLRCHSPLPVRPVITSDPYVAMAKARLREQSYAAAPHGRWLSALTSVEVGESEKE